MAYGEPREKPLAPHPRGTLANQMAVSGYQGHGLVNSYLGGDGTKGTLTSRPFKIERGYINFLVGGGHHPTETCVDLLVDGRVIDSATGPAAGGGNEHVDWHTFDVRQLAGKEAVIRIVDSNTGGWGHVLVDQITQSDERLAAEPATRELPITARYLNLPVRTGAKPRHVRLDVEGRTVREFDVELADSIKPEGRSVAAPLAMRPRIRPARCRCGRRWTWPNFVARHCGSRSRHCPRIRRLSRWHRWMTSRACWRRCITRSCGRSFISPRSAAG